MAASDGVQLANPSTGAAGLPVAAGTAFDIQGGIYVFVAVASAWSGATAALQILGPDGATWVNAGTNGSLTANGNGVVYLPSCIVRLNVTGGTPTNLYAALSRVVA